MDYYECKSVPTSGLRLNCIVLEGALFCGHAYDLITFILKIGTPKVIRILTERIKYDSIALAAVMSPISMMLSILQPNSFNSVLVLVFAFSSFPATNREWSPLFNCFGFTASTIPIVLRVFTTLALGK